MSIGKEKLSERDIEDYLWNNPNLVSYIATDGHRMTVDRWIARQLVVPSGIIDLFGVLNTGWAVVVELKIVPLDGRVFSQVSRYANDINFAMRFRYQLDSENLPIRIVIGTSCSQQAVCEAAAEGIIPIVLSLSPRISFDRAILTEEYVNKRTRMVMDIGRNDNLLGAFDWFYESPFGQDGTE